jgi:hypothetical protein
MERMARIGMALPVYAMIILIGVPHAGTKIAVSGSWLETVDQTDLNGGPGSDFVSSLESASDQVTTEISGAGNRSWRVDVKKTNGNWHTSLFLDVRRTSDGSGSGSISGGTAYQEVDDTDQAFFSGDRSRSAINLQLRLRGISVQVPCDTYTTTIYYTVVDTN